MWLHQALVMKAEIFNYNLNFSSHLANSHRPTHQLYSIRLKLATGKRV